MAGASEAPRTLDGVLARMDDTFQESRDAVARLAERDFERSTKAGGTLKAMITFDHHPEHRAELEAVLV